MLLRCLSAFARGNSTPELCQRRLCPHPPQQVSRPPLPTTTQTLRDRKGAPFVSWLNGISTTWYNLATLVFYTPHQAGYCSPPLTCCCFCPHHEPWSAMRRSTCKPAALDNLHSSTLKYSSCGYPTAWGYRPFLQPPMSMLGSPEPVWHARPNFSAAAAALGTELRCHLSKLSMC